MKKTFITLAWVVGFVVVAGFALNLLLPNVTRQVSNAAEEMLFKATGLSFDFNGDGVSGQGSTNAFGEDAKDNGNDGGAAGGVEGFGQGSTAQ